VGTLNIIARIVAPIESFSRSPFIRNARNKWFYSLQERSSLRGVQRIFGVTRQTVVEWVNTLIKFENIICAAVNRISSISGDYERVLTHSTTVCRVTPKMRLHTTQTRTLLAGL